MSLRVRAKADKRRRILQAARRLFDKRGYTETTVQDVARAARVATGTIFLYARDKQALLALVFGAEIEEVQAQAELRLGQGSFEQELRAFLGKFYEYYGQRPELSRVFLKELAFSSERLPELRELTTRFLMLIAGIVQRAQARGELRTDASAMDITSIIFSLYWAHLMAWLGGAFPSRDAALAHLASSITLVMEGLGAGAS